jgi:hypothetical protein
MQFEVAAGKRIFFQVQNDAYQTLTIQRHLLGTVLVQQTKATGLQPGRPPSSSGRINRLFNKGQLANTEGGDGATRGIL